MTTPGLLTKVTLTIRITALACAALLWLFFVLLYIMVPSHRDVVVFAVSALAGGVGLYGAFYIGHSVKLSNELSLMGNSFCLIREFGDLISIDVRTYIKERIVPENIPPSKLHAEVLSEAKLQQSVNALLNKSEDIAIAILRGFADEDVVYQSLEFTMPYFYNAFLPYIERERVVKNYPRAFVHLQGLVERWEMTK